MRASGGTANDMLGWLAGCGSKIFTCFALRSLVYLLIATYFITLYQLYGYCGYVFFVNVIFKIQ